MNRYEEVIFLAKWQLNRYEEVIQRRWRDQGGKRESLVLEPLLSIKLLLPIKKKKFWSLESVKDKKSKRRRGDRGVSIKDNINVRLGFMVQSWKSFLFNSILKLWEIFRKIIFNYGKILEKRREMIWLLTWLNESVATLNATLQLLVIYRLFWL